MNSRVVCLCANNDVRALTNEVNRLKNDVDGLNARVATLTVENVDLNGQLNSSKDHAQRTETVNVMMRKTIRKGAVNIADLKNKLDVANQEKRKMIDLMASYSAFRDIEVKDLREKIADLQRTIDRLAASP